MIERSGVARTPRAEDELEKFVRREIEFQRAERIERPKQFRRKHSRGCECLSCRAMLAAVKMGFAEERILPVI